MSYYDLMTPAAEDLLVVDRIADEFEFEWRRGSRPNLESFASRAPLHLRSRTINELVQLDVEYRRRVGERPTLDEYHRRLPNDLPVVPEDPSPASDSQDQFRSIGRYFVLARMKADGQGEVFLAVHPTATMVVLKFLRQDLDPELEFVIRREAEILAQLDHPFIAPVLDIDRHQGRLFIAVKYVAGQTLDQHAKRRKILPLDAARLVASVARTLADAHDKGIFHLDIKPRNVIIDSLERPHVIDFGAAWVCNARADDSRDASFLAGTLEFASPEQVRCQTDQVSATSDVFGLGTLLFFLLTGHPPYRGPDTSIVKMLATRAEVPKLDSNVPAAIRRVVEKATSEQPRDRYHNARDLATDLEQAIAAPEKRTRLVLAVAAVATVAMLTLAAWKFSVPTPKPPQDPTNLVVNIVEQQGRMPIERSRTIEANDELEIQVQVPHDVAASMWLLDSSGILHPLGAIDRTSTDRMLRYPKPGTLVKIPTKHTAWTVFCLTSSELAPTQPQVENVLQDASLDVSFPPGTILRATSGSIESFSIGTRSTLQVVNDNAEDAQAREFLDHIRSRALSQGLGISAIAFGIQQDSAR